MRRLLLRLVLVVLVPLLLVQAGIYYAWYLSSLAKEEKENLDAARRVAAAFEDYVGDVRHQETPTGSAIAGLHPYSADEAYKHLAVNEPDYPSRGCETIRPNHGRSATC